MKSLLTLFMHSNVNFGKFIHIDVHAYELANCDLCGEGGGGFEGQMDMPKAWLKLEILTWAKWINNIYFILFQFDFHTFSGSHWFHEPYASPCASVYFNIVTERVYTFDWVLFSMKTFLTFDFCVKTNFKAFFHSIRFELRCWPLIFIQLFVRWYFFPFFIWVQLLFHDLNSLFLVCVWQMSWNSIIIHSFMTSFEIYVPKWMSKS